MNRQDFIRCICESPRDDAPRLIFADWLDEHGEFDRAEFIRLQCQLYPYQRPIGIPSDQFRAAKLDADLLSRIEPLVRRYRELFERYLGDDDAAWSMEFSRSVFGADYPHVTGWSVAWRRGFVSYIGLWSSDFSEYAAQLFELQPIEHVTLHGIISGDGIVFRSSDGYGGLEYKLWNQLRMPRCRSRGECQHWYTHAHMTPEELSTRLVAYGRALAGLPELTHDHQEGSAG